MNSNMKATPLRLAADRIAAPLASIASPQRVAILLAIGEGEACVCHLEAALGWRQPYISQHLMELRSAGILTHRREGRFIYYRLKDPSLLELIGLSARLSHVRLPASASSNRSRSKSECPCPKCGEEEKAGAA